MEKEQLKSEIVKRYGELPNEFYGHALFERVLLRSGARTYPDTIMRYFRELRENGVIRYECVNKQKSLYMKS